MNKKYLIVGLLSVFIVVGISAFNLVSDAAYYCVWYRDVVNNVASAWELQARDTDKAWVEEYYNKMKDRGGDWKMGICK